MYVSKRTVGPFVFMGVCASCIKKPLVIVTIMHTNCRNSLHLGGSELIGFTFLKHNALRFDLQHRLLNYFEVFEPGRDVSYDVSNDVSST